MEINYSSTSEFMLTGKPLSSLTLVTHIITESTCLKTTVSLYDYHSSLPNKIRRRESKYWKLRKAQPIKVFHLAIKTRVIIKDNYECPLYFSHLWSSLNSIACLYILFIKSFSSVYRYYRKMLCSRYKEPFINSSHFLISGRFSEDQKRRAPGEPHVQSATFHFITRDESLNPSCGLY